MQQELVKDDSIIKVEDLRVQFRTNSRSGLVDYGAKLVRAVDGVNLNILRGEIISLVGESGSGKTTLGRTILGLEKPSSGRILVNGLEQKFGRRNLRQLWKMAQMVFQDPYSTFNPLTTIHETLSIPVKKFGIAKTDVGVREKINEALGRVGLNSEELEGKYPTQLSGGQRQRLAIARALIVGPQVLVADEPVSMLDVSLRAGILDLIVNLNKNLGLSVLFITHDLAVAQYISDRIAVMYRGEIVELGPAQEVIKFPLHPYTELLLRSAPKLRGDQSWITNQDILKNVSPNLPGCKFYNRCPLAVEKCANSRPRLDIVKPERSVSCFVRGVS
jgi:peptide/nickel transport system ATP-binding protein